MNMGRWMSDFIMIYLEYKHNSVVIETINYKFVSKCHKLCLLNFSSNTRHRRMTLFHWP